MPLTLNEPSGPTPPSPASFLNDLPDEILLQILEYLDIPELLIASRVNHHLRTLSLDPLLHHTRLHRASLHLSHTLPHRPPLTHLIHSHIYISRTSLLARSLSRNLIRIRLNRRLDPAKRPTKDQLMEKGVLPMEMGKGVSPALVEVRRRVERERVKDVLRGWVADWRRMRDVRGRVEELKGRGVGGRVDVRVLARRFGGLGVGGSGGGGGVGSETRKEMPTRAKVLGLKRFWEGVGGVMG